MPHRIPFRAPALLLVGALVLLGLAALPGGAVHAGQQPETPAPSPAPVPLRSGSVLFHEVGCEHCHGVEGVGTERGPSLLTVGKRLKKDAIERQIHDGGGGMPAFADALQPDEIQQLVGYLATKKKAPKGVVAYVAPPASAAPKPASPEQ